MLVRERDASEEAPLGGVRIPVIGMVAPAMADDHHLPSDGWRSEGRVLLIGAWSTRVPGGRSSLMVLAIARPSRLVWRVSCRQR